MDGWCISLVTSLFVQSKKENAHCYPLPVARSTGCMAWKDNNSYLVCVISYSRFAVALQWPVRHTEGTPWKTCYYFIWIYCIKLKTYWLLWVLFASLLHFFLFQNVSQAELNCLAIHKHPPGLSVLLLLIRSSPHCHILKKSLDIVIKGEGHSVLIPIAQCRFHWKIKIHSSSTHHYTG